MAKTLRKRIVKAVNDAVLRRDRAQMRAVGALLSAVSSPKPPASGGKPVAGARRGRARTAPPKRWTNFSSVLCPIDFSEPSRQALRTAAAVAARDGAALSVLYVNDPLLTAALAAALHDRQLASRRARELRAFVAATLSGGPKPRSRVKTLVTTGSPAEEIVKAAADGDADLIVMGTHGLSWADRLILGSTTQRVLENTRVPVLAVPAVKQATR